MISCAPLAPDCRILCAARMVHVKNPACPLTGVAIHRCQFDPLPAQYDEAVAGVGGAHIRDDPVREGGMVSQSSEFGVLAAPAGGGRGRPGMMGECGFWLREIRVVSAPRWQVS